MHNFDIKKYYFINKFDTKNLGKQDKNTIIIYRNYLANYDLNTIINLKKYCKKKSLKFVLANNIKLSIKLNLDGAYLPSFNKNVEHLSFSLKKNFLLLGSAHNLYEIKIKELQKIKIIFLSSLFKKNKNYLGIYRFKMLTNYTKLDVVALGGISKINQKKLNLVRCTGLAGISYFK